jgi:hypothetical protein
MPRVHSEIAMMGLGAIFRTCRNLLHGNRSNSEKTSTLVDLGDILLDELDIVHHRRAVMKDPAKGSDGFRELTSQTGSADKKIERYQKCVHETGDISALCLSGGGIRSAAFALGIAQGLAKKGVLSNFDYLSTVSGGGYLGSFLTAWVQRRGYAEVSADLAGTSKANNTSPLQYLRRYSSYLIPQRGLFTADTLTIIALYFRNLLFNWLIIIPLVLCGIAIVKIVTFSIWAVSPNLESVSFFGVVAITCVGLAALESLRQRPGWESDLYGSFQFQLYEKWPLLLGGVAASCTAIKYLELPRTVPTLLTSSLTVAIIVCTIHLIAWLIAFFVSRPPNANEISTRLTIRSAGWPTAVWTLISFAASGALIGFVLGGLFYWISAIENSGLKAFVILCFGPPIMILAYFLGDMLHIGITSYIKWGDAEREWLATAAGFHGRASVSWFIIIIIVFGGSYIVFDFYDSSTREAWKNPLTLVGSVGGISGLIVALLGKASATAATIRERYNTWKNWSASVVLSIAAPVFIIISVSFLSAAIDAFVAGRPRALRYEDVGGANSSSTILLINLVIVTTGAISVLTSFAINTNRFSLHGLYRNRLIRAFLGASRSSDPDRLTNPLTGFDEKDNVALSELWPNRYKDNTVPPQLLVVNCALNILASTELAWQERKALSFTATPRSAGAGALDQQKGFYRRTNEYADNLSLGTAITISGAAVSPNMGYHSSPAMSVLMTFFNVRLGAWLGNPGPAGSRVYAKQGPVFSIKPLVQEALGLTTEDKSYVYLSDGGHFENLGLYEMIRRRCRYIVVSDAGCDPTITFEDLGNAVRKISIDMSVKIEFDHLKIAPRKDPPALEPSYAIGRIRYPEENAPIGHLIYIKPTYQGIEPASVRSYAATNPAFPHEPTTDQLFGESQFEAYRALGEFIVYSIDGQSDKKYLCIEDFVMAVSAEMEKKAGDGVT